MILLGNFYLVSVIFFVLMFADQPEEDGTEESENKGLDQADQELKEIERKCGNPFEPVNRHHVHDGLSRHHVPEHRGL